VRRYDDAASPSRLSPPSRRRRPRPEGIFPTSHARFDDDDDDDAASDVISMLFEINRPGVADVADIHGIRATE